MPPPSQKTCRKIERVLLSTPCPARCKHRSRSVSTTPARSGRSSAGSSPACATGACVAGRTSDGTVVLPPPEFDPVTHRAVEDFVEVSPTGTVVSWTWVPEPVAGQPFDRPFAFVLVRLDGADAPFLHALDVASPDDVRTGMRVRVRWAEERIGAITDIECASSRRVEDGVDEPVERDAADEAATARDLDQRPDPVTGDRHARSRSTTSTPRRRRSRRSSAASRRAGSSASAARRATRSTCRRAARARSTAWPPPTRSSSPTRAP